MSKILSDYDEFNNSDYTRCYYCVYNDDETVHDIYQNLKKLSVIMVKCSMFGFSLKG